jgi:hypothetical protein
MDLTTQMLEDAEIVPDSSKLNDIATLALKQLTLEDDVAKLEEMLKRKKEDLRRVSEEELPVLMGSVTEFRLANGRKIVIKPYYSGSINDENADLAFTWLREHGHDDIIKNQVIMQFGKGEDKEAETVMTNLKALGYNPENKKAVHPMTLKAFIREQVESGAEIPLETFKAHIGRKATIK